MSEATVTEETGTKTKAKKGDTNLILEVAQEVEHLSKTKALNLAGTLAENIETNYFKLGGVLKVIHGNGWFEGYETFDLYVYQCFGFRGRKAEYLMGIYTHLVDKQIPWDKVHGLGWTKLKDLAPILTLENVDEWVAKATHLSVVELQAALKATVPVGEAGSTATKDDISVIKFKLKNDQLETVNSALAAVKAQIGTDHDNVALETLCSAHLAGVSGQIAVAPKPMSEQFVELGYEKVLEYFDQAFPQIDLSVSVPE